MLHSIDEDVQDTFRQQTVLSAPKMLREPHPSVLDVILEFISSSKHESNTDLVQKTADKLKSLQDVNVSDELLLLHPSLEEHLQNDEFRNSTVDLYQRFSPSQIGLVLVEIFKSTGDRCWQAILHEWIQHSATPAQRVACLLILDQQTLTIADVDTEVQEAVYDVHRHMTCPLEDKEYRPKEWIDWEYYEVVTGCMTKLDWGGDRRSMIQEAGVSNVLRALQELCQDTTPGSKNLDLYMGHESPRWLALAGKSKHDQNEHDEWLQNAVYYLTSLMPSFESEGESESEVLVPILIRMIRSGNDSIVGRGCMLLRRWKQAMTGEVWRSVQDMVQICRHPSILVLLSHALPADIPSTFPLHVTQFLFRTLKGNIHYAPDPKLLTGILLALLPQLHVLNRENCLGVELGRPALSSLLPLIREKEEERILALLVLSNVFVMAHGIMPRHSGKVFVELVSCEVDNKSIQVDVLALATVVCKGNEEVENLLKDNQRAFFEEARALAATKYPLKQSVDTNLV